MKKNNKILSQGNFDGHCLQYSVMNAFKALSDPSATAYSFSNKQRTKWQKIIALTPSLQNFSSGFGSDFGISTLDAAGNILQNLIFNYFEAIGEKTKNTYHITKIKNTEIESVNFKNSVLIFCLKEKAETEHYSDADHWVCCAGKQDGYLHLACSHVLFEIEDKYEEMLSNTEKERYFNTSIELSKFRKSTIYTDQIFCVRIVTI